MLSASKQQWQAGRVLLSVGALAMLTIASGCSVAAPHAPVTKAQRAALTRLAREKLSQGPADPRVACPVDVLGAAHVGRRLRVYTVAACAGFTRRCLDDSFGTSGLVADLIGTKVVRVQLDDAPYYQGMISEADIYPASLRSTALGYINSGGPDSLMRAAADDAGCPHADG